ncbi:hypothetical protein [Hydrogenophaga sp.]|uniref:hypothetical protein n=1 Tax=Hydrogenophaga sp. TaxID=1904254 RepID=UPI0027333907|nr:hypothetical protein [Hydrogenophaga sp.]MDP1573266.1 hypothetical protein [Pseudomonadota bacterium]MDP1959968.1 hypothetical protein [Methylotenera sp.]MDP3321994.1 hypothetical protein [Hydrogenophaga sp.]MDP3884330.1 hypothetical protein [Hydrogenophaga sp.]
MSKQKLLERVTSPNHMYSYCRVVGCPNSASAGTTEGLNHLYCRKHEDHYERHGSYTKRSYTASEINPYRKIALGWLKANTDNITVKLAIKGVEALYRNAGIRIEAFRLRGLSPQERAKVAWARLREAKVDPIAPLAVMLAVELVTLDDPQPERKQHFKWVQAAKLIHRMSSGSHKRWERVGYDGKVKVEELHKYPRSRGRVLVHIGQQLDKVAELAVASFIHDNKQ